MSVASGPTFRAGLVQMRTGLDPAANLDAAVKLIGEAKAAGADYVQTPEMTNIMELRRELDRYSGRLGRSPQLERLPTLFLSGSLRRE